MVYLSIIVFALICIASFLIAGKKYKLVYDAVHLGKGEFSTDRLSERIKNTFLIALGQKKMFKLTTPAIFHLFIYLAFLVTQIELIEIFIDGFTGKHRMLYANFEWIRPLYFVVINLIEILSLLALLATFVFLARRNLLKVPRFQKSEMTGWPTLDGNIILYAEIVLVMGIFTMNGADVALHPGQYPFLISNLLQPIFSNFSVESLQILERIGWWLHILTVFALLNYLPYSKHLHIFLAFPNTFFAKLSAKGSMENMPAIQKEVVSMMSGVMDDSSATTELPDFGANDVTLLSKQNLLAAFTCTECGRCTDACPANITGKKLSPRKIMMDVRDRATAIQTNINLQNMDCAKDASLPLNLANYADGKNLFDAISREEIHACTTCNACVEACPILINPLDIILQLRRYEILTESTGPTDWLPMFNAIENGGAVWQMNVDRENWINA